MYTVHCTLYTVHILRLGAPVPGSLGYYSIRAIALRWADVTDDVHYVFGDVITVDAFIAALL